MMPRRRLVDDMTGAAAIEFAFAIPVLACVMIGILQFGMILHASGGMRHAVGEGIRHAKIYPNASSTEVLAEVRDALSGINPAGITSLTFERGTSNNAQFGRISMTYQIQPVIPFVPMDLLTLTESKTAYVHN